METFKQRGPEWSLRISLAVMYLYSGIDLISHPSAWRWAIPAWLQDIIGSFVSVNHYIQLQGAVEIIFALVFLGWFLRGRVIRWIALISTLEFIAILALAFLPWNAGNFSITFRDIGLVGASAALYFSLLNSNGKSPSQN